MKNKNIFYILLSIFAVFLLILIFLSILDFKKQEPIIGGDKDEHGCLISAGYSWNEEFEICVRAWTYKECPEMKGEICNAEFKPVCGLPNKKQYTNECFACLDLEVTHTIEGVC